MQSAKRMRAVVIDLDCITGLQAARVLAAKGVEVIGVARDPRNINCRTNAVRRVIQADTHGPDLLRVLEGLGQELDAPAVLFPCSDAAVVELARGRERLGERLRLMLAPTETVEDLALKSRFYRLARDRDWSLPPAHFLSSRAEAEELARSFPFPGVLKPPLKTPAWARNIRAKVVKVGDAEEFLREYDRCAPHVDELILQEWIPGGDDAMYSCYTYHDASSRLACVAVARKIRQWPLETGSGSLSVTLDYPELVDCSRRVLEDLNYHGLAFLQYKRDPRTGRPYLIEPNVGRPGAGSTVCEAAGVEMIWTQYCEAAGLELPGGQAREGAKWVCWRRDLMAAFQLWRRGELGLGEWWRSLSGKKRSAVLSVRDPLPFVLDLLQQFGRLGRALVPGRSARTVPEATGEAASGTQPERGRSPVGGGSLDGRGDATP